MSDDKFVIKVKKTPDGKGMIEVEKLIEYMKALREDTAKNIYELHNSVSELNERYENLVTKLNETLPSIIGSTIESIKEELLPTESFDRIFENFKKVTDVISQIAEQLEDIQEFIETITKYYTVLMAKVIKVDKDLLGVQGQLTVLTKKLADTDLKNQENYKKISDILRYIIKKMNSMYV